MLRLPRLSISNGGLNGRSPPSIASELPGRVARRWLDLHDVGAPVGEQPAGGGARDPHAELDDANTLHRSRHRSPRS